jgi:hypothetical protein
MAELGADPLGLSASESPVGVQQMVGHYNCSVPFVLFNGLFDVFCLQINNRLNVHFFKKVTFSGITR